MKKILVGLALSAVFPTVSLGLLVVVPVTKKTQEERGLNFTLRAVRGPSDIILVALTVPRKGKLASLHSIRLSVREGRRIILSVPLRTQDVEDGAVRVFSDRRRTC